MQPTARLVICGSVAAIVAIAAPASANVVVATFTPTAWEFKRTQMPDIDQKWFDLPNGGACYCVPTSLFSVMSYASNHGFPSIGLGGKNWLDPSNTALIMSTLADYGDIGNTSPGGVDPQTLEDIPCATSNGGSKAIVEAALAGTNGLVQVAVAATETWAPTDAYLAQTSSISLHPVASIGYSRYKVVGTTPEGWIKLDADGGGHRVTLTGLHYAGDPDDRFILVRDPGDSTFPAAQSEYLHRKITASAPTDMAPIPDPENAPDVYWHRKMTLLNWDPSDEKVAALTTATFLWPLTGFSFTEVGIFPNLPINTWNPIIDPPIPQPTPGGEIVLDLAPQMDNLQTFVLTKPTSRSTVAKLWSIAEGTAPQVLLSAVPQGTTIATTRFRDVLVLAGITLLRTSADAPSLAPTVFTLPAAGSGIAYDDASDHAIVATASDHTIRRISIYDPAGPSIETIAIPSSVPLSGAMRVAVSPTDHGIWFLSAASSSVFGLIPGAAGGYTLESIADATLVNPTSIDFDDHGRAFVVGANGPMIFGRGAAGMWDVIPDATLSSFPIGQILRIAKSRNNFGGPTDVDFSENEPTDVYEPLGIALTGCSADLDLSGDVNAADLAMLLGAWGSCVGCDEDLNHDDVVDASDLGVLLGSWGLCPIG